MEMDFISLIQNVGFPIAITFYFIFRMEKTINKNTDAINNLSLIVAKQKS